MGLALFLFEKSNQSRKWCNQMKIFKKSILSTVAMTAIMAMTGCNENGTALATKPMRNPMDKPNVVLVLLDDAGYADISANGGQYATPNIDRIADTGVNFSTFYTSEPVSSPSRAGILTGRLGVRNGMYGKATPVFLEQDPDGLPKSEVTVAEMLRDNGYNTVMYGKWHLGIGKDGVEHIPTRHGFNEWYGIPTSNDMFFSNPEWDTYYNTKLLYTGHQQEAMKNFTARESVIVGDSKDGWGVQDGFKVPVYHSFYNKGQYSDDIAGVMQQKDFTQDLTDRAVKYIKDNKDSPFFMFLSYPQNHVPLFVSDSFKGKTSSPYGDVMSEIDYSVGKVMDTLQQQGLDQNTIVIFTSDNGPWLVYDKYGAAGSALPHRDGKNTTYDGGVAVPGIIRWSGQIVPSRSDDLISTLDLFPTIAKFTGSKLPSNDLDGYDISDTLLHGAPSPRKVMPYFYKGNLQAYRSGDWKIHFITSSPLGSTVLEHPTLYNIRYDVSESKDLSSVYPEIVQDLIKESESYKSSLGKFSSPLFDIDYLGK